MINESDFDALQSGQVESALKILPIKFAASLRGWYRSQSTLIDDLQYSFDTIETVVSGFASKTSILGTIEIVYTRHFSMIVGKPNTFRFDGSNDCVRWGLSGIVGDLDLDLNQVEPPLEQQLPEEFSAFDTDAILNEVNEFVAKNDEAY